MPHQPQLIPDQPATDQAARDAERAAYLERLREKLMDPEFRRIEGFPIGADEDILALSDPPYYTACPNPFLPEIVERWQAERAQLRAELGLPDDSTDNGETLTSLPPTPSPSQPVLARGGEGWGEGQPQPIYRAEDDMIRTVNATISGEAIAARAATLSPSPPLPCSPAPLLP
jgi:hypothetical protein